MDKEMWEIRVRTEGEHILITQLGGHEDDSRVIIVPEQVDGLIEWLEEAKAECADNTKE